ncbi:MAG TPA: hypothetical protein VGC54_05090 [Planctomycetota bacterium]
MFAALLAWPGAPRSSFPQPAAVAAAAARPTGAQDPAAASDLVQGEGAGFHWQSPAGLAATARRFAPEVEGILADARGWLGAVGPFEPVRLEWVRDREELAAALQRPVRDWFAAVALPFERRMVIAVQVAGGEDRLRLTLRHEILHLAMADRGPAVWEQLPAWFHEGCAEVFAGDVYLGQLGAPVAWRAFTGELEPLQRFEDGFPASTLGAATGYRLGHEFVSRLQRLFGQRIVPEILAAVESGRSFDGALIDLTGLSLITHETAMRDQLASMSSLAGEIYPQLFLAFALLMIVSLPVVRAARRRKKREFEDRWASDDSRARMHPALESGLWREPQGDSTTSGDEEPDALEGWVEDEW